LNCSWNGDEPKGNRRLNLIICENNNSKAIVSDNLNINNNHPPELLVAEQNPNNNNVSIIPNPPGKDIL